MQRIVKCYVKMIIELNRENKSIEKSISKHKKQTADSQILKSANLRLHNLGELSGLSITN